MNKKMKGRSRMVVPTIIMGVLAAALLFAGYHRGQGQHIAGTKTAVGMIIEIMLLLIFAFIIAGMVKVLLPHEAIARYIGKESGLRGILIGTVVGGLAPGGPYVSMPIAAGLLRSGAGVGTMVAFITSWSLWAVGRLPLEVGIMGWRFALVRIACTFFFPPIAGLIAQALFGGLKFSQL